MVVGNITESGRATTKVIHRLPAPCAPPVRVPVRALVTGTFSVCSYVQRWWKRLFLFAFAETNPVLIIVWVKSEGPAPPDVAIYLYGVLFRVVVEEYEEVSHPNLGSPCGGQSS